MAAQKTKDEEDNLMSQDARRALEMKEQLEKKAKEVAQIEGELIQLKRQMTDQHSCSTVKQAATKLKKSATAINDMETRYAEGVQQLEADYDWEG